MTSVTTTWLQTFEVPAVQKMIVIQGLELSPLA